MSSLKRNERDWAGQLISWLKSDIENGRTIFQDATNDTGLKLATGGTKFPDILLYTDKVSGVIFNGWELKFPDTPVDDRTMLGNALEKARRLGAHSFVTWNGAEAVIWGIDTEHYSIETLCVLKRYPAEKGICTRDDLARPQEYIRHEPALRRRATEILLDLEQLYHDGRLKSAICVTDNITDAIRQAADILIPQFRQAIATRKGKEPDFRKQFNQWKLYESSTIATLSHSSRRPAEVEEEELLAKFCFYNLIGKILFYQTLCANLSGRLEPLQASRPQQVRKELEDCFQKAGAIDFQAIFRPYFTDELEWSPTACESMCHLLQTLTDFDFRLLPGEVIGNILEHLVPEDEKQRFGQYFTHEVLANLVAYPAVPSCNSCVFDPTSGTGSFLSSFYHILKHHGCTGHAQLLSQIWGNDISHFPAILSVISLYKQAIGQTVNFPRVLREDLFNLQPGATVQFPDPQNATQSISLPIPAFDGIASNFPFIQQEDIPALFKGGAEEGEMAPYHERFVRNKRADYFTYCLYHAAQFLRGGGMLSAITSNAWLGKEYGADAKRFMLENFHIRYVVRSTAEHWFRDSQADVSTVYFVLEKKADGDTACHPTKFVTLNVRLHEHFDASDVATRLRQIEAFYADIELCELPQNRQWKRHPRFKDHYSRRDGSIRVCITPQQTLQQALADGLNWGQFFISSQLFTPFATCLCRMHPTLATVFRGERTGWDPMYIIPAARKDVVEERYLTPLLKDSSQLTGIDFSGVSDSYLFVCHDAPADLPAKAAAWVNLFRDKPNKNNSKTVSEACAGHKPYWYSLHPHRAHIITSINPYRRYFFSFSLTPFAINQRLIAMEVAAGQNVELVAALLNSIVVFLWLEMQGTNRYEGVLDLNANDLKILQIPDPNRLQPKQEQAILTAFRPLAQRPIENIDAEVKRADRIHFDETVLRAFGIDPACLPFLYEVLTEAVHLRVTLKDM